MSSGERFFEEWVPSWSTRRVEASRFPRLGRWTFLRHGVFLSTLCRQCGSTVVRPKFNWSKIQQVFPEGIPLCGMYDAAIEQGAQRTVKPVVKLLPLAVYRIWVPLTQVQINTSTDHFKPRLLQGLSSFYFGLLCQLECHGNGIKVVVIRKKRF